MKQLTVHSDGFGSNTIIVDEDGNTLDGVVDATVYMQPREPNKLLVEVIAVRTQIKAMLEEVVLVCPVCEGREGHRCDPPTLSGQ